jgi:threonine aldolase
MIIDLRSDTVTRPGTEMLELMFKARVGDMVFDEDPAVNELEEYCAHLFGKEKALFCPSGTMTNQIAIKLHTQPGDDVICSKLSHIYLYEGGGIGFNSGASVTLIDTPNGIFSLAEVVDSIQPDDPHRPRTSLVSLENTMNRGGGAVWPIDRMSEIANYCRKNSLAFHLDGARLFNAIVATGNSPLQFGEMFDTISICLSKGLGAPVGSVLIGSADQIKQGKRVRKVLGGTMRQAGYLAAAGLYALKNNVERIADDHSNAQKISDVLKSRDWVENVMKVETNIVIFNTVDGVSAQDLVLRLKESNILALATGKRSVRFVTHLDISDKMVDSLLSAINQLDLKPMK